MSGTLTAGANPLVPQGQLNRILTSVVVPNFPQLTVTAPFLGKESVVIAFEGETTTIIDTLTGIVLSPNPYQITTVRMHLLKSQNLAVLYETQRQAQSAIGPVNVITDSTIFPVYALFNCSIYSIADINMSGDDAGYRVTLRGFLNTNSSLFAV